MRKVKKHKHKVSLEEYVYRKENLAHQDSWIVDYTFDREKELWCEVSV